MTLRNGSTATLGRILLVVAGLMLLASCGGGSSTTTTPPTAPAVSLSATGLTFASQTVGSPSSPESVTVTDSGNGTLVFASIVVSGDYTQTNNCGTSVSPSGSCTINVTFTPSASGTRTGTLTLTDNASTSPQTVSLTGTGAASTVSLSTSSLTFPIQIMVGTPSTSQSVTLNNTGTVTLTIASIVPSSGFSETDNCDASVSAGGSCTINVTFTPTAAGTLTGTLTITDNSNGVAGSTQTVNLTGSGFSSNTAAVNVNFGPNGNTGNPGTNYYNGIYTTVTVCEPGTTTCQSIDNVLVDTGSTGLRVLSNQLGSVSLQNITDNSGDILYECAEYGDTSYSWGPMQMATVQIGGEMASQVPASVGGTANSGIPIQVITLNGIAPTGAPCTADGGPSDSTVAALGANGILGIGNYAEDCGEACVSSTTDVSPYPYILCNSGGTACELYPVPLQYQIWNPVPAFASADTNGVVLQLPSIPAAGQGTVAGSLVFGIGTETCPLGAPATCIPNGPGSTQVYALDQYGNFSTVLFNGVTYSSPNNPGFLDSGSNALFVSDAATLGISDCTVSGTDIGYYCPGSTLNLSLTLTDLNGVSSGPVPLSIANALSLFSGGGSTFAAFNDLGGDSGTGPTTDAFDFGLPFFFGRNVSIGVMGTTPPNGASAPNGYVAF
ncbi:MAG: DUF3443 family protein [Terriglobia bacterium]